MGKLGCLALEPAVRYERRRPGELIHIDVERLGEIQRGAGARAINLGVVAIIPALFVSVTHPSGTANDVTLPSVPTRFPFAPPLICTPRNQLPVSEVAGKSVLSIGTVPVGSVPM